MRQLWQIVLNVYTQRVVVAIGCPQQNGSENNKSWHGDHTTIYVQTVVYGDNDNFKVRTRSCKELEAGAIYMSVSLNLSGVDSGTSQENQANAMVTDALTPCVTRPLSTMVINVQDKHAFVFHENQHWPAAAGHFCEMIKNANIFHVFEDKPITRRLEAMWHRSGVITLVIA